MNERTGEKEREKERDGVRVYIGVNGRERLRDLFCGRVQDFPRRATIPREIKFIHSGQDDHVAA